MVTYGTHAQERVQVDSYRPVFLVWISIMFQKIIRVRERVTYHLNSNGFLVMDI
jgi:hypothetical protein